MLRIFFLEIPSSPGIDLDIFSKTNLVGCYCFFLLQYCKDKFITKGKGCYCYIHFGHSVQAERNTEILLLDY